MIEPDLFKCESSPKGVNLGEAIRFKQTPYHKHHLLDRTACSLLPNLENILISPVIGACIIMMKSPCEGTSTIYQWPSWLTRNPWCPNLHLFYELRILLVRQSQTLRMRNACVHVCSLICNVAQSASENINEYSKMQVLSRCLKTPCMLIGMPISMQVGVLPQEGDHSLI